MDAKTGKTRTFVLFLVLAFGMPGFVAKAIIQKFVDVQIAIASEFTGKLADHELRRRNGEATYCQGNTCVDGLGCCRWW